MSLVQNHLVNILVVDSDATARARIHDMVVLDGYSCLAVNSIETAIASAQEKVPDLLISDMNLQDGTAVQLSRRLTPYVECPSIYLSASRDPEMVQFARRGGATFFLAKPLDADVLMELIDKALWMPHLVKRHLGTRNAHAPHQVKAPTFSLNSSLGKPQTS